MQQYILYTLLSGILFSSISCSPDQESIIENHTPDPVSVIVSTVQSENNSNYYTSSGTIQATSQTNLSTRIMGYVQQIHTHIGDHVSTGQLLITLNNKDLKAKLAQVDAKIAETQIAYTLAKKDFTRYKALYRTESASQKELDDITAHYEMASSRLEGAKQMKQEINAQLEYTNIRSPFSGVISAKFINKGDLANPGMPLLSVENNSTFDVVTMVSEQEVSNITPDMPVKVTIKSNKKELTGRVIEISTSTLHSGAQYQIKVRLDSSLGLYSGMYTQVEFPISQHPSSHAIFIPTSALVTYGQLQGVYMVSQQNTAVIRWLRLGHKLGQNIEVLSGLNPNDKYIISAQGKLENGSPLTIIQ